MNVKVYKTLVWLNLLSFGTKGLAAPTIGIQSNAEDEAKAKAGLSAEKGVEREYVIILKILLML
jgi:hypothetical protein